jgi:hypothetical protein
MSDPRIRVTVLADPATLPGWLATHGPAAVLTDAAVTAPGATAVERFEARPPHRFGCRCCAGRSGAAMALDRLFQARARAQCGWFDRVVVLAAGIGQSQVAAALRDDALALARYRAD